MHTDAEGHTWGDPGDPIDVVVLLTNGGLMVFTPEGHQIPYYQAGVDRSKIKELVDKGQRFAIVRFRDWQHEISREEFAALAGMEL